MICTNAARVAQAKGLHRRPANTWNLTKHDELHFSWLFWAIYCCEKHIAHRSGRPSVSNSCSNVVFGIDCLELTKFTRPSMTTTLAARFPLKYAQAALSTFKLSHHSFNMQKYLRKSPGNLCLSKLSSRHQAIFSTQRRH